MPLRLGRRTFLRNAGATVIIAAGLRLESAPAAASDGSTSELLNGVLRKVRSRSVQVELSSGMRDVEFQPQATFNRNGAASLSDFRVGDRVVIALVTAAEAEHGPGLHMEVRYGLVSGTVQEVDADRVVTTGGSVVTDANTIVHALDDFNDQMPLSALPVGASVQVITAFQPATSTYLARRIGVAP